MKNMILLVLGIILAQFVLIEESNASDSLYVWNPNTTDTTATVNLHIQITGTSLTGQQSFGILSTTGEYMPILTSATDGANATQIYFNNNKWIAKDNMYHIYFPVTLSTKPDSPNFSFAFNNGSEIDSTYTATSVINSGNATWTITNTSQPGVTVTISTGTTSLTATPSAVPIPGSALLLGSSLLGLVGIGRCHKKKNNNCAPLHIGQVG